MRRMTALLGVVLCMVAVVGCSDDDDDATGLTEEKVGSATLTTTRALQIIQSFIANPPFVTTAAASDLGKGDSCVVNDCSMGGTVEICQTSQISASITVDNCVEDGSTINGTILATLTGPNSATFLFNANVNSVSFAGPITIAGQGDGCLKVDYDGFVINDSGFTGAYEGDVIQCEELPYPDGSLDLTGLDSGGGYEYEFTFNGTNSGLVVATHLGSGDMFSCTVDFGSGAISCN